MADGTGSRVKGTVERELGRVARTVRQVADGLDATRVSGELGRDASRAWGVLTRDHAAEPVPSALLPRLVHWCRLFFVGVTAKLTRPRRVLFVVCLLSAVLGLGRQEVAVGSTVVVAVPSPLLFIAIVGMVLLLMLELADRVTVRDELEVARALQRDLLPGTAPDVPGWEFAFSSRTANTIGGDYLDFLPLADGRLAVVIGDASGHGIAAGLLMAVANTALRIALDHDPRPAAVAATVNRALVRVGDRRAFMTLFYGLLDPVGGRLEYVCAGHPYPYLRRVDGTVQELGAGSVPLGIRTEVESALGETGVGPGDLLVLYTDGVPEELSPTGESFGFDRVRFLVERGGSARTLHDRLVEDMERHRSDERAHDDRSLVVVERLG